MPASVALALGSNQGDRLAHLRLAVRRISERVLTNVRTSPVVETAAWLKPGSPTDWDQPFFNMVVEGDARVSPEETLRLCQDIERESGRGAHEVWSPRTLDIDILAWGQETIRVEGLMVPHPGVSLRPFVLDPWSALGPERKVPGLAATDLLRARRALPNARPLVMGIVNITPDSFSDGGKFFSDEDVRSHLSSLLLDAPPILDFGGQSTRPGAEVVGLEEEWRRVQLGLQALDEIKNERVRPWVSIDTFRPEIAKRAIDWGVEIINDVSGLDDPGMRELAAGTNAHFVFMHHMGVPVVRGQHLPPDCDPVATVYEWAERKLESFARAGIAFERLIFDPGVGFGKVPAHSLALIKRAAEFKKLPVRILYGHSRKSYQSRTDPSPVANRDAITLAHSLHLATAGVEILRVHDVAAHRSALLAQDQLQVAR